MKLGDLVKGSEQPSENVLLMLFKVVSSSWWACPTINFPPPPISHTELNLAKQDLLHIKQSTYKLKIIITAHTVAIVRRLVKYTSQLFTRNLHHKICQQLDSTIADAPLQA